MFQIALLARILLIGGGIYATYDLFKPKTEVKKDELPKGASHNGDGSAGGDTGGAKNSANKSDSGGLVSHEKRISNNGSDGAGEPVGDK